MRAESAVHARRARSPCRAQHPGHDPSSRVVPTVHDPEPLTELAELVPHRPEAARGTRRAGNEYDVDARTKADVAGGLPQQPLCPIASDGVPDATRGDHRNAGRVGGDPVCDVHGDEVTRALMPTAQHRRDIAPVAQTIELDRLQGVRP